MGVNSIIRSFFRLNQAICAYFDKALPESANIDGNQYFIERVATFPIQVPMRLDL